MPQLGRLSSKSLAGLFPATGRSTVTWTRYSIPTPTTGLRLVTLPAATNGTVAFFSTDTNQLAATNRVLKFDGSALVEQLLPSPTVAATPRLMAYDNGKFVLLGATYPVAASYDYTCAWVSTDGGNTFSVTNFASGTVGSNVGFLTYANNNFYVLSYSGSAAPKSIFYSSSSNGSTWSSLVSGGTTTAVFPFRAAGSSGTRILSRGYLTAASGCYLRLISSTLSSVAVSPSIGDDSATPDIAWVRGFGFVLLTGVASGSAYSISEAALDSGSSPSVWSAPGTGFGNIAVADNGVNPPVVYLRNASFGSTSGKISFDGGSTFSTTTLPTPPSGSYPSNTVGANNRIFVGHYSSGTQIDITVGVIS